MSQESFIHHEGECPSDTVHIPKKYRLDPYQEQFLCDKGILELRKTIEEWQYTGHLLRRVEQEFTNLSNQEKFILVQNSLKALTNANTAQQTMEILLGSDSILTDRDLGRWY
ncbi:hypothetical protein HGA88_03845 [Candidatus Roizmanbacteria bacterium]|nr:hypothetical protein [Candidatus Roizmanbacteria bacterium]